MKSTELMDLLDQMQRLVKDEADALARSDNGLLAATTQAKASTLYALSAFTSPASSKLELSTLEQGAVTSLLASCQTANRRNGVVVNLRLAQTGRVLNRSLSSSSYGKDAQRTIEAGSLIASA